MKRTLLSIACIFLVALSALAQNIKEGWIAVPGSSAEGYGVYKFRKDINVATTSRPMRIWITGDNRYKLFINGRIASIGPARSDIRHWNCEEVDIAPYLHSGRNTVAAVVWNEGPDHCQANPSYRTGFYVHAVDQSAASLNTGSQWLCIEDKSYSPAKVVTSGWYIAGPGERVDMHRHIANWLDADADLSGWKQAEIIAKANFVGQSGIDGTYRGWMLKKSELPQRELKVQRLAEVRQAENVKVGKDFLTGKAPAVIPANTKARIILDNKALTNAYVTVAFSGGDNSRITLGYAEAFYTNGMEKGNRNDIKGKHFEGRCDTLISNGRTGQLFTTLYWRTYRYIVIDVTTKDSPLTISDIYGTFTAFPFVRRAGIDTDNQELQQIFNIGWRTARLCAIETYMDCPYYEQMQYFGDSRIQALVSLYMTGDDRLVKEMLQAADWSRTSDGVTQSRFPSDAEQWIQTYALSYIFSLHDYLMYGKDLDFLRDRLMSERTILDYFHHYQTADGRLKNLPGWNFTDWVFNQPGWKDGTAIPGSDGSNSVLDLQLLYAYQMAADLERKIGLKDYASLYDQRAEQLRRTIYGKYWRAVKGLLSDRSDGDVFSQHANALAILTGTVTGHEALEVARKIESDTTLAPASIYFTFYAHEAMSKAGLADDFTSWLGIWRENVQLGLTTWAEDSNVKSARSDCHAWGASPNIAMLRTVLGIDSDAPFFKHVSIAPLLGSIKKIGGTVPTPWGDISVSYLVKGNNLDAHVTLPESITGSFSWRGKQYSLHGGENVIKADR